MSQLILYEHLVLYYLTYFVSPFDLFALLICFVTKFVLFYSTKQVALIK